MHASPELPTVGNQSPQHQLSIELPHERRHALGNMPDLIRWGLALLIASALIVLSHTALRAQECTSAACASTLAHLVEVDTTESELLDPLLGALLGQETALGLTLADYDALANADVALGDLLERLQIDLAVATPEDVLTANLTLPQLVDALAVLLPGNIGLDALQSLPALPQPIVLGELLHLDGSPTALGATNLNLLDLIVGSIQLFNHRNVAAVEAVALDNAALTALGLPDLGIDGVSLRVAVLEAPRIVCGPAGSEFSSANIRLALDAELAAVPTTLTALDLSLLGLTIEATPALTLADLSLYIDIASGEGVVQSIDANAPSATVNATPGIARIFLGSTTEIDDFFALDFDPATDLISATVGTVGVATEVCLGIVCSNLGLQSLIAARSTAVGGSGAQSQVFSGPFPQTLVFTSGASSIATLAGQLLANLEVDIDLAVVSGELDPALLAVLGGLVDPLLTAVEDDLLAPLTTAVGTDLVQDEVSDLLSGVADPLLNLLGTGIGEMAVTLFGANGDTVFEICAPLLSVAANHIPNPFVAGAPGSVTISVANHVDAGATTGPVTVTFTLPAGVNFNARSPATWQRIGSGTAPYTFVHADSLQGGESVALTLHLLPTAAGTATIAGSVATAGAPNVPFSHAITVAPAGIGDDDSDGDGIPDDVECPDGVAECPDTDGDGTPDHQDGDDDGDGINTGIECPGSAATSGLCPDSDGDGTPDYRDADDDGDGVYTIIECAAGRTDGNSAPCPNTDGADQPDYLDTDDDNDGLTTKVECPAGRTSAAALACPDTDGDGSPDYLDAEDDRIPADQDTDGDGVPDRVECPNGLAACPDTDGDGTPDHQDQDDDGDGVATVVECPGGPPCPDTDSDGQPDHRDVDDDGDGVYTVVECPDGRESAADAVCPNTDGDALPNYLDADDDNDGASTVVECPAGRISSSAARCPTLGNSEVEDYLNPEFALRLTVYNPIIHNTQTQ